MLLVPGKVSKLTLEVRPHLSMQGGSKTNERMNLNTSHDDRLQFTVRT